MEVPLPEVNAVLRTRVGAEHMVRFTDYLMARERLRMRELELKESREELEKVKHAMTMRLLEETGHGRNNMLKDKVNYSIEDMENYRKVLLVVNYLFAMHPYPPDDWMEESEVGDHTPYGMLMKPVRLPPLWERSQYWKRRVISFALVGWIGGRERLEKTTKKVDAGKCVT